MARRSPVRVGLALAFICVVSYGQATDTCRSGCRGTPHTFKYAEGTTYKYNFDSKVQLTLSSAEGQQSVTEIKATVLVTQQPQCNQVVKLQNVQVISNDGKKHSNIPDVEKPIRINNHDGHIEDSICATPGDTQNSLNLKRAVASLLQANLKSGHETDVFGLCPTDVSEHKEGNVVVVEKTRNLNRCAYRESVKQGFLATAFNLDSEIRSSPILNGDYRAKLRIKNGILEQATVTEQYLYVPFSVGNNGAKASVETTLKYVGTSKDNSQVKVSQPKSIIFEDPHPVNSPHTNVNNILEAVKKVAKTIDITVGEHTAKEFTNLIRILRVSKKDDLLAVYNQVRAGVGFSDKTLGKKIFLDALLRAGNGDNVEVAIELLKNKELTPTEQHLVYLGLSTVRHATESSINAAVILLNQPQLPRSAYLGIGNLAGRFCRQHSCENVESINKLTQKLVQKLGSGKASNRHEENEIVNVLKALGNIHHLNDNILAKITAVAQDKKNANRLRVTALETYKADPCKDKLRDSALTILKDIQQDSEVRIKAYLALAQCPNNKVGSAVKALLENEPSYQVGGFIVSHIRNLRASANPDKQLAKQHLGLINVPKRFPIDLRKWSSNAEFSYSVDSLGIANSIESNIIYSQNSFLPRSTTFNLTAEVFGHNLNFLEIETRQENLDRLVEHYFGPRGLLRANSLQDLWNTNKVKSEKIVADLKDRLQKTLRSRRDLSKSEIDKISKQVQIKTNELNSDLDLDLSVKAFGAEVAFVNVNDDLNKYTPEALIEEVVTGFKKGLDSLKSFDETLRANLLFLDAELAYPTSSGFPLRLGVEGSANLQLKTSGALDIRSLLDNSENAIKLSLIPSANIEVAGRLTIDTLVVESGLKVISTLHTATGGELVAKTTANSVDVKFSLPVQNQNLISATHDIVFHTRDWGASEVNAPLKFAQNKDFSICLDQLSAFIGLTFCGEYTGPNLQGQKVPILPFPLSGDAKVAVTIEKEDLSLYHFRQVLHTDQRKLGAEIVIEALGKTGEKKVSLALEGFIHPEYLVRAALTSPVTSASLEGRIQNNADGIFASLRFIQDTNEYFGKVGVQVQGSSDKRIYKPVIQYKTPQTQGLQAPPYRVEGQVIVEPKGPTYTFDNVRLVIPDQKTFSINGKVGSTDNDCFADLTVSDGGNTASFKGKLSKGQNGLKYNGELKNSLTPQGNVQVKGEFSTGSGFKNFFQLAHGGDFSNKDNILTLDNEYKYHGVQNWEVRNKLVYPAFGTNLQFDLGLKPTAVKYTVNIQYNNVKIGSDLDWQHTSKREGLDFKVDFGLWGLNNLLKLKSKRQVSGEQSQIENSLDVNGKRLEVNGKIKHHVRPQDVDVALDLIVKVPSHNTPFNVVSGLILNANEFDASHKVSSGSTVFVDVFLKANRGGNANGSIKINVKGQLVVTGHIKSNKGAGNGEIVLELPGAKRTSKIDTTFTVNEQNCNLVVNIYPVFNQDKTKKIVFSTHTSHPEDSIDSKNFIDVFGEKFEVNVKGSQHGEFTNGKTVGELEITFPKQQYLAAKLNRDIKNVNNVLNGQALGVLEYRAVKNQPGSKLTVKGLFKNTNLAEKIYDVNYQVSAERSNGRNLNIDIGIKRQVHGDSANLEVTNKIHGSEIPSPIETTIKSTCRKESSGTLEASSSYAPLGRGSISGKFDASENGGSGEVALDVTTTSKSLRTLKVRANGSVLKAEGATVKGQLNIQANDANGVVVDLDTSGEVKTSDKESRVKGTVKSGKTPISVDVGVKRGGKDDNEVQGDIAVEYGPQKVKGDFTVTRVSPREYKLDAKLELPTDKFKNNRIQVHTKRNEDNSHIQSETIWTSDGKTWKSNTDLVLSETTPSIDFQSTCPEGKHSQLLVKVTKLTERQLAGQLKIQNQRNNFLLEGTIDANVESIDDFHIKLTANAPSFKIDKQVIEAMSKPAKTGRRIQVTAKAGNKNILAGSTSYTAREEHGKLIIEGSGSFKVHDKTQSANFKYIRQNLVQAKNGETGLEISFDAGLGNKAIDAELKITNKQFRILNSYCEEKKQCAHVEVDVKTTEDDVNYFNQEVEVAVDLRLLGLSHEFGLKAVTTRKGYLLDHTVDVHIQSQENSKYQYSLYLHPKEAGVSLTTPKRIIALEANLHAPPGVLKDGGRLTGEVIFWTDKKNQPNQKSSLISFLELNLKGQAVAGEVRLTNPVLRKPLIVALQTKLQANEYDLTLTADIFAQPDQKLILTYKSKWSNPSDWRRLDAGETIQLKSSGLRLDITYEDWLSYSYDDRSYKSGVKLTNLGLKNKYQSLASYEFSPKKADIIIDFLNLHVFRLDSKLQLSKEAQIVNTEISCYGHKPLVSTLEIKNLNSVKYSLARKDKPQDKLQVNAAFIPNQIADLRGEVVKNGAKQELGHITVKLDDANFLKSDYNVQSKNIEELLIKPIQSALHDEGTELKQLSDKIAKEVEDELSHVSEVAKRASPNLTPLKQYYSGELQKIKDEILADKTIKNASEFLYNIFSAVAQAVSESFTHFSELVENIARNLQNTFGKLIETIQKDLLPQIKSITDNFLRLFIEVVDSATNIVLTVGAKAAEIAEKYRPELQQLATVLGEVSQDVLRTALDVYEAVKNVVIDQWQQIYNEIKNLPIVEQIRSEYERIVQHGLYNPEAVANGLKDLLSTLKDIAPTPELKELIQAISDYATKSLTHQKIDDRSAIDRIVKAAIASIRSIIAVAVGNQEAPDLQNVKVPVPGNVWNRLPRLAAVRLSPLSYLLSEDVPLAPEFWLSLINQPRNWFAPFPLYGIIAQGQHIFTFDGKHLTFPGNCNYLLARDALDGNFTLIGTYTNGLLTAISLTQGSDTITLKKQGQILVNNAPAELPVRKPHLAAYRNNLMVVLRSDYGIGVRCGPELLVCSVTTSGFYHGKLRGLLGNGNNEPYDDFVLPSGKIVSSESEFGNSYKTNPQCAPVQTVSHHGHHSNPACDKLFGWESSLRLCYPFVPTENFKMACEHGLAAGVKNTEHAIAVSYAAACNQHNIPAKLPSEFVKCTNSDKTFNVGDQFSVKLPGKAADIVVLVETSKESEPTYKDYVQPLIQQLTTELSSKGITDLEFHIIAYGGENQWPSHITTNNGKMTFKGKAPNLRFVDSPKDEPLVTGCPQLDAIIQLVSGLGADIKLALGLDLDAWTYNEGIKYPFRANAIKSVIAVRNKPCQVGALYPLQVLRTLLYKDKTINLNLITPISRDGAKPDAKNIVGFNSRNVFALGATKNKIKHFSDLSKELTVSDYCIDFTLQNEGNVFVLDHIHLQPKASKKQFVQVTSHGIVEQLLNSEDGYDCECKYDSVFTAANVCKLVSSKEKPQARKAGTKS